MPNNATAYLLTLEEMPAASQDTRKPAAADHRQKDIANENEQWRNTLEQRIADIKAQLRFQVLHDLRIMQKEYSRLLNDPGISPEKTGKLKEEVEAEVEQRYQEYLEHLTNLRGNILQAIQPDIERAAIQKKCGRICYLRRLFQEIMPA